MLAEATNLHGEGATPLKVRVERPLKKSHRRKVDSLTWGGGWRSTSTNEPMSAP